MKQPASGSFVLRLPPRLHADLRSLASREGLSLNELCRRVLSTAVERGLSAETQGGDPPWLAAVKEMLGDSLLGAALFGSAARGEARADSDIDILVVVAQTLPIRRELYLRWDKLGLPRRLSPHFVHLPPRADAAGSIWLEAAIDGIIVSDPQGEVQGMLRGVRGLIAKGCRRRMTAYGSYYWIDTHGSGGRAQ